MHTIIIGGLGGTGKSSLSRRVAKEMGLPLLSVGSIFRDLAERRGISLVELNARMLTEPAIDDEVALRIHAFVTSHRACVVEGWFAWHCVRDLPDIYRVKLTCLNLVRFHRIASREKVTLSVAMTETLEREAMMIERFAERCHVPDWNDDRHFDYVVDTTRLQLDQVYEAVITDLSSRVIQP